MDWYNEIDPYAAAWLRNLIDAGRLPFGVVDTRSLEDVRPDELHRFRRCHFFAGIGVWALALEQAGWPDDVPVWTGSCPCQPFSTAGKGAGFADERHLWPSWFHHIGQRRPAVVFGEQVAGSDAQPWLDLVQTDLESLDYAFGAVPFPAASVGAPHIRDRLYWAAGHRGARLEGRDARALGEQCAPAQRGREAGVVGNAEQCRIRWRPTESHRSQDRGGDRLHVDHSVASSVNGFWSDAEWIPCRDGKWRPVEPGTFPLAHGVANRVGRLRAYGNAVVAPQARIFIEAYLAARAR